MQLQGLREIAQVGDTLVDFTYSETTLIAGKNEVPLHYHNNMEIISVIAGEGSFQIDLQKYPAKAGDLFIIPRGALHAVRGLNELGCEYQTIQFDLNLLDHNYLDQCQIQFVNPLLTEQVKFHHHIQSNHSGYDGITTTFETLKHLLTQQPYGFELGLRGQLFWLFFQLFHEAIAVETSSQSPTDDKLAKLKTIINYIHEQYHQTLTMAQLAQLIDYSEYHFMRFFKAQTGITCGEYIQQYRLQQAAELLRTSSLSITDIAYECGFDNSAYFSTCFKKKYITTPSKYREKFKC